MLRVSVTVVPEEVTFEIKQVEVIPGGKAGVTFPLLSDVVMSHPFNIGQRLIA